MNYYNPRAIVAVLSLPLVLAGCAAGSGSALHVYREANPTPYLQSTLKWTDAQTSAPFSATTSANPEPAKQDRTAAPNAKAALLADLLGETTSTILSRLVALEPAGALDRELASPLDLNRLAYAVALANPQVQAAEYAWRASFEQFSQADYLEVLTNQYRTFTRGLNVTAGNQLNRDMTQAYFPSPGATTYRGEMIRSMTQMEHARWAMVLRDQVVAAGRVLYELDYLRRAEQVASENLTLARDLLKVVESNYRTGTASQTDFIRLQNQTARVENEIRDLQSMQAGQRARLNALLNRPGDAKLGLPSLGAQPPDSGSSSQPHIAAAHTHRPELAMARASVARTANALRMSESMNRPPASQGYSVFERAAMSGGMATAGAQSAEDDPEAMGSASNSVGFGLQAKSSPPPGYALAEAYLIELRTRLRSEQATLVQAEAEAEGEVRMAWEQVAIAHRGHALLRDVVLPQSESAFQSEMAGYTTAEVAFNQLLETEQMLLETRLERERARRDAFLAWLDLMAATGQFIH